MKRRTFLISLAATVVIIALVALFGASQILKADTDIPKLYFTGDISKMESKSDVRNIAISYKDGDTTFEGFAEIKVQGTSSLRYDKKNYTIKLFEDETHEETMSVDMGWGAQSKYCLKANWIDKTHARNIVTARLATQAQSKYGIMDNAPRNGTIDGFPIEIYSNGRFLGLYTFNIPKDAWQFNMDSDNKDHIVLCAEGWKDANLFLDYPDFETWSVEVGEESPETQEKANRLFDFVINSSDEEFRSHFHEYMSLDSALNYYVMADFAFLKDNCAKNMLIVTYDGKIWYPSLYDMDTSWGSDYEGKSLWEYDAYDTNLTRNNLFKRIGENFGKELAERYFELRETILTKENILGEFNSFQDEIPNLTFVKEKIRWGLNIPGYDISQIEEFLDATIQQQDEKYGKLLEENK